jgi:competence protein CoiA
MLFANVNGEKTEATPKTKGICLLCEREVFSKCGEVNVWHWSHFKDESCDSWYEPETEWHKNWKLVFGKDYCEIVISKESVRHIADIQTKEGIVIELQNSPIQKPIIRRRESFYGGRMIWVINGRHFKHNFIIYPPILDSNELQGRRDLLYTPDGIVDSKTGELISRPKKERAFLWSWPRKSWIDVKRNVFIDFGDENLFWIIEGMGTSRGKGKQINKLKFLEKYGGDITLLPTLIDKSPK